jgi:hypothetical protein
VYDFISTCSITLAGLPPVPLFAESFRFFPLFRFFSAISYKSLLHIENTVQNKIRYY